MFYPDMEIKRIIKADHGEHMDEEKLKKFIRMEDGKH